MLTWSGRVLLVVVILASGRVAFADQWPQFRGPSNAGVIAAEVLPSEWSTDKHIEWKVDIPGTGWSCPIIWGDRVFVTSAITENQRKPRAGGPGGGFGRPGGDGNGPPDGAPPRRRRPPAGNPGGNDANESAQNDAAPPDGQEPPRRGGGGFGGRGGRGGMGGRSAAPPDVLYRWEVICLDRLSGSMLWSKVALERKPTIPTQGSNTYASETPVTDGERLYVYFGMHGLFCYDFDGNLQWKKDLGSFPMRMGFGTGSSPALDGDRLFVQCDNEKESFLVAFDKKSGDELWRKSRTEQSTWATPFVWKTDGRTEIVTCAQKRVRSYDPATGNELWEVNGMPGYCSATPVTGDGLLFLGSGGPMSNAPLLAVKAGATGDISLKDGETSNAYVAWSRTRSGPAMASPLYYKGYLYILELRGGMISCYEAKTGKEVYNRKRLPDARGFTASPWANNDKIFCLDDGGQTTVLKAGPEFEVLGQNKLDEMCWSTPAAADGKLYLRTVDHLFCIK